VSGLFVMGLVTAVSRWRAGLLADRHGVQPFLWPLMVLAVAGTALVAWSVTGSGGAAAVPFLAGMVVIGLGYGALQNLTLVAAFAVVSRRQHQVASAVWNVGFDAGTALGSVLVGSVAGRTSFATAFLVAAAVTAALVPVAVTRPRHAR
jgi:predicted MFS family arabinose efflux permease